MKARARHRLVFENRGLGEARDIKWSLSALEGAEGSLPVVGDRQDGGGGTIPVIAGGAQIDYPLDLMMGDAPGFLCSVEWSESGKPRQAETTLRV
jgi:hypothetical protein